jgi:hypothetical protein
LIYQFTISGQLKLVDPLLLLLPVPQWKVHQKMKLIASSVMKWPEANLVAYHFTLRNIIEEEWGRTNWHRKIILEKRKMEN